MPTLLRATLAIPGFNNYGRALTTGVAIYTLEQEVNWNNLHKPVINYKYNVSDNKTSSWIC